jgi:hypothetical protein
MLKTNNLNLKHGFKYLVKILFYTLRIMNWFSKSNNPPDITSPDSTSVNSVHEEKDLQKVDSNNESSEQLSNKEPLETSEKKKNSSFWSFVGLSSEEFYHSLEHCLSHANSKEKVSICMETFKEEEPKEEDSKEDQPKEEESKEEESKEE